MCAINYRYTRAMDFARPVEALIPGVQGRVLAVLANTDSELTMRTVASLSGVSSNRASAVLNHLVSLGVVQRREVGTSALVRLVRENEAARLVLECSGLRSLVLRRFQSEARKIKPAPMCLVAFGSFAMGEAREGSDIDVLAVTRGAGENAQQVESLGHWSEVASSISGNPVNLIRITEVELPKLIKRGSFWRSLSKGVVLIVGTPPPQVKVIG